MPQASILLSSADVIDWGYPLDEFEFEVSKMVTGLRLATDRGLIEWESISVQYRFKTSHPVDFPIGVRGYRTYLRFGYLSDLKSCYVRLVNCDWSDKCKVDIEMDDGYIYHYQLSKEDPDLALLLSTLESQAGVEKASLGAIQYASETLKCILDAG